jgi:peptidyl-Lys metalloendopeptidase
VTNKKKSGLLKLSAKIELNSQKFKATDREIIKFILTNNSNKTISVLKWTTPLEGIDDDMFWVKKDEEVVVYLGRILKRAAPKPEDYVTLDPKESVSTDFDLAEVYDISGAGKYSVEYDSWLLDVGIERPKTLSAKLAKTGESRTQKLHSNTVTFTLLEDRRPKQSSGVSLEWRERLSASAEVPDFRACTATQRNLLEDALTEAEKMAKRSQTALSKTPARNRSNFQRYKEWFGNYTGQNYNKIKNNFNKIVTAIVDETIIFNCSTENCGSDSTFAYVYPTRPYEIFLCNAFWRAKLRGTDSRAGTIIHELTHFNVVSGTDDITYGQAKCRELARTDPSEAIVNADNHEYFAENTPVL